jgi:YidC/Oxa1 family membrane protein insertase
MDRQQVLGFALIFLLLIVWMVINTPAPQQPNTSRSAQQEQVQAVDTLSSQLPKPRETTPKTDINPFGKFFSGREKGQERLLTIETDLYKAKISSKGGLIREWEFKNYKTWDGHPVQLVDYEKEGDFSLLFVTTDGKKINTRELYFDVPFRHGEQIKLEGDREYSISLILPTNTGGSIVKTLVFRNGRYDLEAKYQFQKMADVIAFEYQIVWETGLRYAEHNSIDESSFAAAYAYAGKELIEINASNFTEKPTRDFAGVVDWVATRNKYFAVAIIPEPGKSDGAYLEGTRVHAPDKGEIERYSISVKMPFKGGVEESASFRVFLGPLDIDLLRSYDIGLEGIMSLGWVWIIRPISEYIMLPLMSALHYVIPNWGLVIIVFTIIIKIVLHPLTKSSMKSMKKMQALQPMMEEIREKYKDDPQKMNMAIMNLYREYGVNPAGGCLPLLLQFPILIALYNVFRGAIELRQAEFVWWIRDLSVPDVILTLPFTIPFFGITNVSGLALLMGITMYIQQKMSVKDPRQKMMVWLMPIMFTLLFNSFPSGLNLYYFVFNVLSIGQQMYINKQHDGEPLRKVEPKKQRGGIFGKFQMPKMK